MGRRLCWIAASLILASACSISSVGQPEFYALVDVSIIDGTGSPPVDHQTVLISDGQIIKIGPNAVVEIPAESTVLNLAGRYVVPGFVDLHVHFPSDSTVHQAMLDRLLEYGVTTILNPGARPNAGVELRKRLETGERTGPGMHTAGPIIEYTTPEGGLTGWSVGVTSEADIRHEVRRQADLGVDWVKLYRRLPPDLVTAAIEEAHQLDLFVVGHMGETTWGEAARAGIDMLVHSGFGTPMDEVIDLADPAAAPDREWYHAYADATTGTPFLQLAQTLRQHQVVVVPTLSITQASGLGADATLLPQFRVDLAPDTVVADTVDWWSPGWRERHPQYNPDSEEEAMLMATVYFPGVLAIVRKYYEMGIVLGVGTDVGNSWMTPGFVYHHELGLYQEAGIPPLEILKMATYNGASALGMLADIGSIETGKQADIIVLGSDPSTDIHHTRDIEMVFLNGRPVATHR